MKKLLIILLSALSLTAVAQDNIKRVAILEIVDKMGTVPYMKQLVFRSNLTTAISNTLGYEGYDRVDLQQILGEQNFQRTGLVSDADIKKIGEFTGSKYVIVAEAVIDGDEMFITAKITDVETARVLRNSSQLMGTSTAEMKAGSEKVAVDLLTPTPEERAQLEKRRQEEAKRQKYENLRNQGYVDLGLPSKTWWKKENENGCFSYTDACNKFGNKLPTKEQYQELLDACSWEWIGNGYKLTSKYNQKSIVFSSFGSCTDGNNDYLQAFYLSRSNYYESYSGHLAWIFIWQHAEAQIYKSLNKDPFRIAGSYYDKKSSVRLVVIPNE